MRKQLPAPALYPMDTAQQQLFPNWLPRSIPAPGGEWQQGCVAAVCGHVGIRTDGGEGPVRPSDSHTGERP